MVKSTFYQMYSINMLRFVKAHGLRHISKGINEKTGRTFWIFEMTPELSRVLKVWTENKKKMNLED